MRWSSKLWRHLTINQMLMVSHLVLIAVVILGLSYSRYQSELKVRVEQQVSLAKGAFTPLLTLFSSAISGRNYANLMMPMTRSTIWEIEDLQFLQLSGISDYHEKVVNVRYAPPLRQVWRTDVEAQELSEREATLDNLLNLKSQTEANNHVRLNKLDYLINKAIADINALRNSIQLSKYNGIHWNPPPSAYQGYFFDDEKLALHIKLALANHNGGELWAVFDASELDTFKRTLLTDLVKEALIALFISLALIVAVTAWIVSPIKSLASSMRQDIQRIDPTKVPETQRSDEIGELARSYSAMVTQIHQQMNVLQKLSDTDPLTALGSRHKYNRVAEAFTAQALSSGQHVVVIIADIDNFKSYNDCYGHTQGDNVLCQIATIIDQVVGRSGEAFRFGGEEFVVIAKAQTPKQLEQLTTELNQAVSRTRIEHTANPSKGIVTLSAGAVIVPPSISNNIKQLLEVCLDRADKQLYQCKHNGRDHVIVEPY